mmetsp:Transcript_17302/g.29096  ORF Transcript_17302/g.29096 Transcript_17302/m.29096 type:complete len:253 (+) Transcript_17302:205-963(+)|eukprot:CAMPEP_0198201012 /NCGR_PEP_ID=MMETSP1445-20131203/3854_1 /TAXON_ID=36898 /ORGANISM="Pyramimonas sp., Strain CCMP2087" /LENGTH=252 /DNA_ID=CAMNT_0043871189 /DNA_START=180 /DNA_END=938 /DNA_ORIENTATION=+
MRRTALRDRLRRLNDPGKIQLQVERDSEGNAISVRSRRPFSSSLSPPRERTSTGIGRSGWVTQLNEGHAQSDKPQASSALLTEDPDAFRAEASTSKATQAENLSRAPTPSEELAQWKPVREGEGAGNRWRFKDLLTRSSRSLNEGAESMDGRSFNESDNDDDDDTMSVDSFASSGTAMSGGSTLGPRLPVSQRATQRWVASSTAYVHTGAVPAEFTCSAIGFLIMIAFLYCVQYALRHGYIQPSQIPNIARQ